MSFNDYLVFADEAGDHLLRPHDAAFPIFVLAFCIIHRQHYADFIAPQLLRLKLKYFQDTHITFHERDIRKAAGPFAFLTNAVIRTEFMNDLTRFMQQAEFKVIASVIRKDHLVDKYAQPDNPYDIGTSFGLERLLYFLNRRAQKLPTTVTFESRGKKEDQELKLSFLRMTRLPPFAGRFDIKIVLKIAQCCGLELADLIARPIGRHVLNASQPNRAYDIIQEKIDAKDGRIDGYGLKIFP